MSSAMARSKLRTSIQIISLLLVLTVIAGGLWFYSLDRQISERIGKQWFLPPLEFYTSPMIVLPGLQVKMDEIEKRLTRAGYRERRPEQLLRPGDFTRWNFTECQSSLSSELPEGTELCFVQVTQQEPSHHQLIATTGDGKVTQTYAGQPFVPVERLELEPMLFAQYYGGRPILRRILSLSEIPLDCLQAVTAIEDDQFLEHQGISVTGIARATIKNILAGRVVEGASTITQQLVKNYFLSSERTFSRKFKEMFMSLILEAKYDKEVILEAYLNVIYMGQNGPFQVRGFGAASEHYFSKPIENLDLAECSLLAALLNNPGRYNPFRHPEKIKKRRKKTLDHMLKQNHIDEVRYERAVSSEIPKRSPRLLSEPAPYFVDAVIKQIKKMGYDINSGLRIYTTLDIDAQEAAQVAVRSELKNLIAKHPKLKKQKEEGHSLQASLVSMNLQSGGIVALVGGSSFKRTQYNRAVEAHRQVGSIMKPFVYLAALESVDEDGQPYTPLSPISDDKFDYKYEGQVWSPVNYDGEFNGMIPMFYGLKNSLNVATAGLGLDVGLSNIMDVARRAGVTSEIKEFPSLTLGAFELYPMEVLRAYATLARMGSTVENHLIRRIENMDGDTLYMFNKEPEQVFDPANTAVLVGMMKQTIKTGTGRSIPTWRGFIHPSAGKTGTTSDTKDAWFAGFTPYILTVVWVGYDDNTAHNLTGASGAIPFWANYMKKYAAKYPQDDFNWPENTVKHTLDATAMQTYIFAIKEHEKVPTELIFKAGTEPKIKPMERNSPKAPKAPGDPHLRIKSPTKEREFSKTFGKQ